MSQSRLRPKWDDHFISHYYEVETKLMESFVSLGVVSTDQFKEQELLIYSFRARLFPNDQRYNIRIIYAAMATSAAPTYFQWLF